MKRQTQKTGIRYWYGGDIQSIQEESLKVLDEFFGQFGPHVLAGCQVTANGEKFNVSAGLVLLEGVDAEGRAAKMVVPFQGAANVMLPIYLTLTCDTETRIYKDGNVKPISYNYRAVASTVKPVESYATITKVATTRFVDVIQDAAHRFITDVERTAWNKAIQDVAKYTQFDYVVDSNAALTNLNNNPNATCVLIKKGTWSISTSIMLHTNTKRIVAEPGSVIQSTGGVVASFYYETKPDEAAGYSIQGVNLVLTACGAIGFHQMVNLSDCTCECAKISSQDESNCFHTCNNLNHCGAIIHERYHPGYGYWMCENLHQCKARSDKYNSYATGISRCKGVVQCYSDCSFNDCHNVSMCQTNIFVASYFSSTANTSYKCADTMNGGWNQLI